MPAILDVAIGTVFVFLLFSILVTALNEIWLSLLDKRAAFLKYGLKELLIDGGKVDSTALLHHGLIASLSRGKYEPQEKEANFFQQIIIGFLPRFLCLKLGWTLGTRGVPSYIPGKSFVLALLSLVKQDAAAPPAPIGNAPTLPAAATDPNTSKSAPLAAPSANADLPLTPGAASRPTTPLDHARADKASAEATLAQLTATAALNAASAVAATAIAARQASQELHTALSALPEGKLRSSLLALYADAAGDMEQFKANLENWFNECMDRVGGWYKRYAQQWLFFLALLLAVSCNVDGIHIIRALSADPKLRASIVAQAESYSQSHRDPAAAAPGTGSAIVPALSAEEQQKQIKEKVDNFNKALADLGGTGIPMGWDDAAVNAKLFSKLDQRWHFADVGWWPLTKIHWFLAAIFAAPGAWLSAAAGWILSALAATLGAPFWFDLLNRFVDIRGVGRAPEEKDSTAPKKKAGTQESYLQTGDSKATAT